ncbi:polysaccharide pyruvyl transferase family protein [Psychrobacter sp. UBA6291]|uniref:polysaccharide pyruvyl transferase family protein n=1 Tax=Psychrobacter sp. UBA6291 TaxID=1947357 RepID=UPI00257A53E6|nr:polysaccharide pyruvyl transferase family protein [Psychrobacter sp. UBA6291]
MKLVKNKIPYSLRAHSLLNRLKIKIYDYYSIANALAHEVDYLIVGCYNTSNIGDIALGKGLSQYFSDRGKTHAVVSFKALKYLRFIRFNSLVLGGGGILTTHDTSPIKHNLSELNRLNKNIYLVGVSGSLDTSSLTNEYLKFLKSCKAISLRSDDSYKSLKTLNIKNIHIHNDLAFLIEGDDSKKYDKKTLAFNVFAPLITVSRTDLYQELEPSKWYRENLPRESEVYKEIPISYIKNIKSMIQLAKEYEFKTTIVSFTLEDYILSRMLFKSYADEILPYEINPDKLLKTIGGFDKVVATRFHAHVFSLISGKSIFSMAYAYKCKHLYQNFGLDDKYCYEPLEWVCNNKEILENFKYFLESKSNCMSNTYEVKKEIYKVLDNLFEK